MPRKARLHVPGALYHVTLRGNHRQDIFFCDEHRRWMEAIVADSVRRYGCRVLAFCWMTNHVHLLVQVGAAPLGRFMLRVASLYARRVQRHLSTRGHLFERRYHAILVDADAYLLSLIRYVHQNPVRARMVASAGDYPWSSHHAYLGGESKEWLCTEVGLSMFAGDIAVARSRYRAYMEERLCDRATAFAEINPNDTRILGCDDFVANINGIAWRPKSSKTVDCVMREACAEFGVSMSQLKSKRGARTVAKARAWIAHQCVTLRVASVSAVAKQLGRDESTLRECMERHFPLV
jgi:REP element-mobilizing transposase RayT